MEELKYPQKYKNHSIIILDDLNEKELNNDKIQVMFSQGCQNNLSIFINSQDYYKLPKKTKKLMVITITYSNQTISENKTSIKTKLL